MTICVKKITNLTWKFAIPSFTHMITFLSAAPGGAHKMTAWQQFVDIISKPDNMPVAGALLLVIFFTWISIRQARHNDRLIADKRKDEILADMQK